MERFNRYLKESFVRPLISRLASQGIVVDAALANSHVGSWLRDVANPRVHAGTRERPVDRLAREAPYLQPLGQPWTGLGSAPPVDPMTITVPQHDLSVYDGIGGGS